MDIVQIYERFPDQESCTRHLEKIRWGDTPRCPYCRSENSTPRPSGKQRRHWCNNCHRNFSVTVRTIFHHTRLPLQKWLLAIALTLNARKGISALQLARDLRVSKSTARRVGMQIREAMAEAETSQVLSGDIEMDEVYLGGRPRKKNQRKDKQNAYLSGSPRKTPVVGAVMRKGKVVAKVAATIKLPAKAKGPAKARGAAKKDKLKGRHMRAFAREYFEDGSHLITDGHKSYKNMPEALSRAVINHKESYVEEKIHTNTIESFWALLKRGLRGQYHSVSDKHLHRYVAEACYRYNIRGDDPGEAFENTLRHGLRIEDDRTS